MACRECSTPRGGSSTAAATPFPEGLRRGDVQASPRREVIETGKTRQPFRRRTAPGTTRWRANRVATALQRPGPPCAGSYSGHTPPLRCLKHPGDHVPGTGHYAGYRSGSQVSADRHAAGHVARGALPPGHAPYVPDARPGIVSAGRTGDFGSPKAQAAPYPPVQMFRGSAPSPATLTGKPLRASHGYAPHGPGICPGSPGLIHGSVSPVTGSRAPHAGLG
jgi:hypothetical protein